MINASRESLPVSPVILAMSVISIACIAYIAVDLLSGGEHQTPPPEHRQTGNPSSASTPPPRPAEWGTTGVDPIPNDPGGTDTTLHSDPFPARDAADSGSGSDSDFLPQAFQGVSGNGAMTSGITLKPGNRTKVQASAGNDFRNALSDHGYDPDYDDAADGAFSPGRTVFGSAADSTPILSGSEDSVATSVDTTTPDTDNETTEVEEVEKFTPVCGDSVVQIDWDETQTISCTLDVATNRCCNCTLTVVVTGDQPSVNVIPQNTCAGPAPVANPIATGRQR